MTRRNYNGKDKKLDEVWDREPKISGEHKGVKYRIYTRKGHYCAYIQWNEIKRSHIETKKLPYPPAGDVYINYGPDKNNWVGFTTSSPRDYNYTSNWEKLNQDVRESPRDSRHVSEEDIVNWTPILLEEKLIEWINNIKENL